MTAALATRDQKRLEMIRPLFAADLAVAVTDPLGRNPEPLPPESACLSPRAIDKRRREFAAGRHAAHQAMQMLDHPVAPVLLAKDRSPIWPDGLIGGLTHTRSCAVAVLGRHGAIRAVGVDAEEDTPLKDALLAEICSDRERAWLATQTDPLRLAKLIFSAKEAAYKCQYRLSETLFGFDRFETEWDLPRGRFRACFTADTAPFEKGDVLRGRFAIGHGLIVTGTELRAPS